MNRAALILFLSLCCRAAPGQYPINPALPHAYQAMQQPLASPAYSAYQPGTFPAYSNPGYSYPGFSYSAYSPYGYGAYNYGPYGFGGLPYSGLNWLPPTLPSPYYVVPTGRQYLEHVRRRDQTTYSQLKLQNYLQK